MINSLEEIINHPSRMANEQNRKYIERVCEMMESYFHHPDVFAVNKEGVYEVKVSK